MCIYTHIYFEVKYKKANFTPVVRLMVKSDMGFIRTYNVIFTYFRISTRTWGITGSRDIMGYSR